MMRLSGFSLCVLFLSSIAVAQILSLPSANSTAVTNGAPLNLLQASTIDSNFFLINSMNSSPVENANLALSKLDLKAPGKAQKEYAEGYVLLLKKSYPDAVKHLSTATTLYPNYVSAHNALGSAYLAMLKKEQARQEFSKAADLDDHLPNSFLNLGCAELALQKYSDAEKHIQQASALAPLDLHVLSALAYSQYMNHDYSGAVTTVHKVHERKHGDVAPIHLYAAASLEAQGKYADAENELSLLLKEAPKSSAAASAHSMMTDLKEEEAHPRRTTTIASPLVFESKVRIQIPQNEDEIQQKKAQEAKEATQLTEAEAECPNCSPDAPAEPLIASAAVAEPDVPGTTRSARGEYTIHKLTEEVALYFAATDHGKSVSNLTADHIKILDNHTAPDAITSFRNQDQLPLRLGLILDTSDSIKERFKFEQAEAADFLRNIVTQKDDLAFVVGFANSVLLVQDFTPDHDAMSNGLQRLVPVGGTALWDAVAFGADKLRERKETQPVSRILVVISDGEDTSSSATAKQAIQRAQMDGVTIYTISTREANSSGEKAAVGERALKTLAELTGGESFHAGSVHAMNGSLKALEQVIRSRYLITYKPADLKRDGKYRPVNISIEQNGHSLRVFARKGYIPNPSSTPDPY
jgi:VWFA-related protein